MKPSQRLDRIPPYLFAELERKIAAKRAAGIDVISLGIGDPDRPTPALIVDAMQEAVTEPETHRYPSNRGRADFREAVADFYMRRFDVELDPATEIMPAIGAKECIFNLNLAFLDPGDAALQRRSRLPRLHGRAAASPAASRCSCRCCPSAASCPTSTAISDADRARAKLMFFNYPNNPTGAIVRPGFFEQVVEFARGTDILAVHDNAYSETTYDGYRAPSFLATPGAKEVGVEVFSLSKGYNMTGWRCAAIVGNAEAIDALLAAEDEHRLGALRGRAARRHRGAEPRRRRRQARDERALHAPPRPRRRRAARDRRRRHAAEGRRSTSGRRCPRASRARRRTASTCSRRPASSISPGGAYGPNGEGFFRISLTTPDDRLLEAVERLGRLAGGISRTAVRYCGIDVSGTPAHQQLCTLHERRGSEGGVELVATFYAPGAVEAVARTVLGFGGEAVAAVDAPSGHRLDLLAPGEPRRAELGLPDGRFERHRVCDALLFRRRLPLYPVPAATQALAAWERWIGIGFELFAALGPLGLFPPEAGGALQGRIERGDLRFGRLCETYPDAVFCSMIGHRPAPKRTPWGLQERIAALRARGVVDADGGLWHRTLDELDACAAAYAAYMLANGGGIVGRRPARGRDRAARRGAAAALRPAAAAGARAAGLTGAGQSGRTGASMGSRTSVIRISRLPKNSRCTSEAHPDGGRSAFRNSRVRLAIAMLKDAAGQQVRSSSSARPT